MGWKEWPSWLKGGLITTILFGIPLIFSEIYRRGSWEMVGSLSFMDQVYLTLHKLPANIIPLPIRSRAIYLILALLIYFLIGAIIGFIYGKIKSKNQIQLNQNI